MKIEFLIKLNKVTNKIDGKKSKHASESNQHGTLWISKNLLSDGGKQFRM